MVLFSLNSLLELEDYDLLHVNEPDMVELMWPVTW